MNPIQSTSDKHDAFLLEDLPDSLREAVRERDHLIALLPKRSNGEEFLVADLQRWRPGQVVRVAFLGGDTALHQDIENATKQITDKCNLKFDFGRSPQTGNYRRWSPSDTTYSADIRVSFDQGGYWSLVGTDSVDLSIGQPGDGVGGRPGLRSLNLARFDTNRPATWIGTTRHEFMHAVAFRHEHQNLNGPCQQEFRWEDDPGYVPTKDLNGVYQPDAQNRRPGIYTYLSGAPNGWNKAKVDHNLRAHAGHSNTAGIFDRSSVMLYRFPPLFYRTAGSACAPLGDGQSLSPQDIAGLQYLYPDSEDASLRDLERRQELVSVLGASESFLGLESTAAEAEIAMRLQLSASIKRLIEATK
jgi:hypothetical protein